ncbi:hypothetical protein [Massilia sp. YMA4]|uniref:hypothetical protein n=1 Tax=Massilia sp. YMA4 TaxID=1593482 RepID=UPI001581A84D|nr:hypothetical protein [Massilia sp. YMA4]
MRLILVLGLAISLSYKFAAASEHGGDATKFTPNASEVLSVTVVLTPSDVRRRAPLREEDLLAMGCNFSENTKKIASLTNILRDHILRDDGQAQSFYLQNAVYLRLRNGSVTRFTFGGEGERNKQINGAVDDSSSGNSAFFSAEYSLLKDLRKWLADDGVERKDGKWCTRNR